MTDGGSIVDSIRAAARPVADGSDSLGGLLDKVGDARYVLIGFSTHTGTVTAARNWGGNAEMKLVVPSLPGSYERLFHETGTERLWLNLRDDERLASVLRIPRLERAIGVIYRPEMERVSHYFQARLPDQFDALIHLDETRAVQPVERLVPLPEHELPATFPSDVPQ